MTRYKPFFHKILLQEKIPLSIARKYVKGWNKNRLDNWFKGKYRIYLPLEKEKQASQDLKSDLEKEIDRALENTQFRVKDFQSGIAFDTKNNREIKLGKVLQRIDKNLLQRFSAAETRAGSKVKRVLVVISRHPYDIAGQSFDRGWTSCKNLSGGANASYVADEVNSVLIAYLIYEDDKNINNPIARLLINQFFNNKGEVAYIPQVAIYGTAGIWEKSFVATVKKWLQSVQGNPQGVFKLNPFEYADSLSTTMVLFDKSKLPDWVLPNEPLDFRYDNNLFIWKDGTWKSGTWEEGVWKSGTWKDGTWYNGIWYSGTWYNGTWKNGLWKDGTWKSGTWEKGIWKDGTWKDGTWKSGTWGKGTWEDGTWEKGYWEDGIWKSGTWKDGTWYNGIWYSGTWELGTWELGTWKSGTWKSGTWKWGWIYDPKKKGNFEKDWEWKGEYVWSPINPREYFK